MFVLLYIPVVYEIKTNNNNNNWLLLLRAHANFRTRYCIVSVK